MGIPAFLVNAGLSLGLEIVTNWLFPKPANKIADEAPQLGIGQPLYFAWGGLCFCPTNLLYALTTAQAGIDDKHSAYGTFGLVNPQNTEFLAWRVNGYIIATKSSYFPLAAPTLLGLTNAKSKSGKKGKGGGGGNSAGTYINGDGLTIYDDVGYYCQFGSIVPNSDFNTLGFGDLKYESLSWMHVRGRRNLVGMPASRHVWYLRNGALSGGSNILADGSANDPAQFLVRLNYGGNINNYFNITSPHGLRRLNAIVCFETPVHGGQQTDLVAIGNGEARIVRKNIGTPTIEYSVVGIPTANNRTPIISPYEPNQQDVTSIANPQFTATVTIGSINNVLEERQMPIAGNAPFRSFAGTVYDRDNIPCGSIGINEQLYGWNGYVFRKYADPTIGTNTTPPTYIDRFTVSLSSIVADLLATRGVDISELIFDAGFDEDIVGFTCTGEDVQAMIVSLCTAYNKFCFRQRDGRYRFMPYPDPTPTSAPNLVIDAEKLIAPPAIEILDESSQPQSVELTFRNVNKQLAEDTIVVGNGNSPYKNKTRINASLNTIEATAMGWRILRLIKNTYVKAELMVDASAQILEPGDIVDLYFYAGDPIRLMVANAEYGQDLTVKLTCVNLVGESPTNLGQIPSYITLPPVVPIPVGSSLAYINAETRTANARLVDGGNLLYTTSDSPYTIGSGDPPSNTIRTAAIGAYEGKVVSFQARNDIRYGIDAIVINNTRDGQILPNSGEIRIGRSWVSYATATIGLNNTYTITGVATGLYGSTYMIGIGDDCYVSGINPIAPVYPAVHPSAAQGSTTLLPETFVRGTADRTYGLPRVVFSVDSGILRIWYGKAGARSTDFLRTKTEGSEDFARSIWVINTANGQYIEIAYGGALMYHEQLLTAIAYDRGDVFELVENRTIGSVVYNAPPYGTWVNEATAT
jgi:hypothetical protein